MNLYDVIESQARFKLYILRTTNEKKRMELFQKSFFDAKMTNEQILSSRKSYIEIIYGDMQSEIELYRVV